MSRPARLSAPQRAILQRLAAGEELIVYRQFGPRRRPHWRGTPHAVDGRSLASLEVRLLVELQAAPGAFFYRLTSAGREAIP